MPSKEAVAFPSLRSGIPYTAIGIFFMTPAFTEYLETSFVTKFPRLIFGGFLLIIGILNMITGVILEVIVKKHHQNYELMLNELRKKNDK